MDDDDKAAATSSERRAGDHGRRTRNEERGRRRCAPYPSQGLHGSLLLQPCLKVSPVFLLGVLIIWKNLSSNQFILLVLVIQLTRKAEMKVKH